MLNTLFKWCCTPIMMLQALLKKCCKHLLNNVACTPKMVVHALPGVAHTSKWSFSFSFWMNQFNYNGCNPIFLKSKTVFTHIKRWRSDLHPFPSNLVNASRELQFKCNFIFLRLNRFNTHMKKQHHIALGRHRITLLGKLYRGSHLHETKAI